MAEGEKTWPGEIRQLKNFPTALREVRAASYKLRPLQKAALVGLMTIIPQETKASGTLENLQRMAVIDAITRWQIGLNDRLDFEGSGRTDIQGLISQSREREESATRDLNAKLLLLPPEESAGIKEGIDIATEETEYIEKWIREKRDDNTVNFSDVERYRALVNISMIVLTSSVILGNDRLLPHMQRITNKNMTIENIADKYSWAMGNNPSNNTERAVMIMQNVGMAGQVIDDWQGREIDELLNIPTYATAALRMANNDEKAAKAVLGRKKKEYMKKAQELGIGKIPVKGVIAFADLRYRISRLLTETHRTNKWLRKRFNHPYLRESAYVTGGLDKNK